MLRRGLALLLSAIMGGGGAAQTPVIPSLSADLLAGQSPLPQSTPALAADDRSYPINLATALHLANATPLDVALAGAQVEIAAKQYDRAKLLWVPNLMVGGDYFRHDGGQQNFQGEIVRSSRSTAMAGFGPNIVLSFSDAVYAPLAARQELLARRSFQTATSNDVAMTVADVYFHVQQARAELAGALLTLEMATEVSRKAEKLAEGLTPPLEATRARVELARRKQSVTTAREQWRVASAELARILRLDAGVVVEPVEPPTLPITLISDYETAETLIPVALTNRPELAGQQAFVQATLARLKQEKIRPLVPSLTVRSVSTNPSGSLGYGTFGGGRGDKMDNFGSRFDIDAQLMWEFSALGFGNRARANERKAEHYAATLELFKTQDRIAAEVVTAHVQLRAAAERLRDAEPALKDAHDLVLKSVEGMGQTRRVGDVVVLIVRPQEVVAAIQALAQANSDFSKAIGDYNRGQFRLYRALGHPAANLSGAVVSQTGHVVQAGK
ncbi:hypothetical protein BH11PLA2_BH11PLA2_47580 [soil metagenome]